MHSGKALNYSDLLNEPFALSNPVGRWVDKDSNVAAGRLTDRSVARIAKRVCGATSCTGRTWS